jgi:hypothetical protein
MIGSARRVTPRERLPRVLASFSATAALVLALAAPASASVASEQQQGERTLRAIQAGELKGENLSNSQYERVGEYLMSRALGSTNAHRRMSSLMDQMMGSAATDRMHVYVGERYLGQSARIPHRYMPMYGLMGMLTGYRGSALAGMMSGYLGGMHRRSGGSVSGSGMMRFGASSHSSGGWMSAATVAIFLLAVLLLAAGIAVAVSSLRHRGDSAPGQPT